MHSMQARLWRVYSETVPFRKTRSDLPPSPKMGLEALSMSSHGSPPVALPCVLYLPVYSSVSTLYWDRFGILTSSTSLTCSRCSINVCWTNGWLKVLCIWTVEEVPVSRKDEKCCLLGLLHTVGQVVHFIALGRHDLCHVTKSVNGTPRNHMGRLYSTSKVSFLEAETAWFTSILHTTPSTVLPV